MAKVKSFVIVLTDNKESTDAASKLIMSSRLVKNEFNIETFDAITPERVDNEMILEDITWNYPWDESKLCLRSGLPPFPVPIGPNGDRVLKQSQILTTDCLRNHKY